MDLTFDNFPKWFELQEKEVRDRLAIDSVTPETVEAAYEKLQAKGVSDRALKQFKTNVVYQIFYRAAPKHERKILEKHGIKGGARDGEETYKVEANQGEVDVAESSIAKVESEDYRDDHVAEIAERLDISYEKALLVTDLVKEEIGKEVAKELVLRLKTLIALLLQEPNLRIAAGALAFAADLAALNGLGTQRGFAAKIGVTPAAISKHVIKWKTRLNLPTNAHMKSDKARKSYSDAQKKKHWRKRKYGTNEVAQSA